MQIGGIMGNFSAYRLSGNIGGYQDRLDSLEKTLSQAFDKAKKTFEGRSPETIAKQNAYHQQVLEDHIKIKELEESLDLLHKALLDVLLEDAKTKSVEEVLNSHKEFIEKFVSLNNEYKIIKKKKQPQMKASKYDDIMRDLSKVNPEFMLYCDPSTLTTYYEPILHQMNKDQLKRLQTKLENAGMFKTPFEGFMKVAIKYFPDYVTKMDIEDMTSALKREPSSFKHFKKSYPFVFETNTSILKNLAMYSPEILLYLPKNLLDILTENHSAIVGNAIVKCPQVLENFYPEFFRVHNPKYVFSQQKKATVINAISEFKDKFPELKEYYKIEDSTLSI